MLSDRDLGNRFLLTGVSIAVSKALLKVIAQGGER